MKHIFIFTWIVVFVVAQEFVASLEAKPPLNVILITADDMNYDAPGVMGCSIKDITPNIDALARDGMLFKNAYVTASVCQPSRQTLMTGRYPHRHGGTGFNPINDDVPTLQESLEKAGYFKGIFAKEEHLGPRKKYHWDYLIPGPQLSRGRDPEKYYRHCTEFFDRAKKAGKPFFLMANSEDPHRPFAGSDQENEIGKKSDYPGVRRIITPEEVDIPKFLPDLPDIRKEVAQYYTSVHRCDETVGKILRALKESGMEDTTLVMFLSDNGMAFPFAKTNVYRMSHQTPWIVRWPGNVKSGTIDERHFISAIDFMPTILDAIGLPQPDGMDGTSFVPVLKGELQPLRTHVYTTFYQTSGKRDYPMRAVRTAQYGYLFSPWSNGELLFKNESQSGLTFKAMQTASRDDANIAARTDLFLKRCLEEFFDYAKDPCALQNVTADTTPPVQDELRRHRQLMLKIMKETNDPLTHAFEAFMATGTPDLSEVKIGAKIRQY